MTNKTEREGESNTSNMCGIMPNKSASVPPHKWGLENPKISQLNNTWTDLRRQHQECCSCSLHTTADLTSLQHVTND